MHLDKWPTYAYELHWKQTTESSERAWELLYIYVVRNQTSSERFIELMSKIPWTFDVHVGYDGYTPGSWRIMSEAIGHSEITDHEYETIARAVMCRD